MAAPKPDYGATLTIAGVSVTPLLTFSGSRGMNAKVPCDAQSDTSKKYMIGKYQPPEWTFSAQLDATKVNALEAVLNTSGTCTYVDPDGGSVACAAAWLSDLQFQSNNDDSVATYSGTVVCNGAVTYT